MSHRKNSSAAALALAFASFSSVAGASCEDLAKFPVTDGKITSAVAVSKDSSVVLSLRTLVAPVDFCRVAVTLSPTSESTIMAEVWLPDPAS